MTATSWSIGPESYVLLLATKKCKDENIWKHNVYISRTTRCTNSYNVSLFIIKCSTCFRLCFGAVYRNWYKPVRLAYTNCDIQLQNITPDDGLTKSETCRALNDK